MSTSCILLRYCLPMSVHKTKLSITASIVSRKLVVEVRNDFLVSTAIESRFPNVPKARNKIAAAHCMSFLGIGRWGRGLVNYRCFFRQIMQIGTSGMIITSLY